LLSPRDHDVRKSVPGLCLQEQSDFQGVLPEWHGKDIQCNKEASFTRSAEVDPMFGNSDGESPVPMANANIAGWLSGVIDQLVDESAARGRIAALHLDINFWDARLKGKPLTISELAEHYWQRELKPDTVWKTYSTKLTYEGYLSKWILPRWEITSLRASTLEKLNCGCDPCLLLDLAAPRPEIS